MPDADRLTPFGSFLRMTSLDELPELFNIVKGDMAINGPRLFWYSTSRITQSRRNTAMMFTLASRD